MENSPREHESQTKKAKKQFDKLGALLVETEPHTTQPKREAEHLGRMIIEGGKKSEKAPKKPASEKLRAELGDKRISTMSRNELLELADKIDIDNSTLRHIYETHLIGEHGLRRLVEAYFNGVDLQEVLRSEILERELDFERDPALRDRKLTGDGAASLSSQTAKLTLDTLLEKAMDSVADSSEEAAFYKAQAAYQAAQHEQDEQRRRFLDVGLYSVIAILVILVIILYLSRR